MMGLALLIVGTVVMVPFTVWHYAGYWNGRYDPEPLTPCHDTSKVSDTSQRKD